MATDTNTTQTDETKKEAEGTPTANGKDPGVPVVTG